MISTAVFATGSSITNNLCLVSVVLGERCVVLAELRFQVVLPIGDVWVELSRLELKKGCFGDVCQTNGDCVALELLEYELGYAHCSLFSSELFHAHSDA